MKKIPLTQGLYAIVDDEDYDRCLQRHWRLHRYGEYISGKRSTPYVATGRSGSEFSLLHRFILRLTSSRPIIDHVNGNGLDCRKQNLRLSSHSLNGANRGPVRKRVYKGVTRTKHSSKPWVASIKKDRKTISLGRYATPGEAAQAYDEAAIRIFGEHARVNFTQQSKQAAA